MIVTRFAPSPTGYLHIGGLRTALYNYLWARRNGGKFLLRIEDTDLKRNSVEAAQAIKEAFEWTNLSYDGEIVYQSQRFDIYKEYVEKLLKEDKAYYCYMSKEELDALREEQIANKQRPRYNGKYRDFKGTPPEGVKPVVRIKAPLNGEITFEDGVKGRISFKTEDILDDFIIARSDGTPTYNFTVVLDDALMGVTDVIRGDDHLSNTPKQIVIYGALGFGIPKFFHVPMINNPQGRKLSKRDGAMDVMEYKNMGFLSEALLNFLVRLGWSYGDQEIFSLKEMIDLFDPNDINTSASSYNQQKLEWLNACYIKNAATVRLWKEALNFGLDIRDDKNAELLANMLRERAKTIVQLVEMTNAILNEPQNYEQKAVDKFITKESVLHLREYLNMLDKSRDLESASDFENATNEFLEKFGLKLKDIAQSVRITLVGSSISPSIFEVMSVIGCEGVCARIKNFLDRNTDEQ
ncbi:MAG: glutamate--tRNA ligase [Campylobacteraceae bacterium]|jgi:glutamyl-tRNA synthetase|nr:glutamate--tRNA ligase [Campylobacteraceae bacterium]